MSHDDPHAAQNRHGDAEGARFSPRKLRPFLRLSQERGVDVAQILATHRTSLDALSDPETKLLRRQCIAIIASLMQHLQDPFSGLRAAEYFELQDLDLLGYLADQHGDVLSAMQTLVDYAPLVGDRSRASLQLDGATVTVSQWSAVAEPLLPVLADYQIASSHRGIALLAGREIPTLRVALARPRRRPMAGSLVGRCASVHNAAR